MIKTLKHGVLLSFLLGMFSGGGLAAEENKMPVLADKPDMTWFTDARPVMQINTAPKFIFF